MGWIDLVQDRDQWRTLSTVKNLRVPYKFLSSRTVNGFSKKDSAP
jgi:hypothetical protein